MGTLPHLEPPWEREKRGEEKEKEGAEGRRRGGESKEREGERIRAGAGVRRRK